MQIGMQFRIGTYSMCFQAPQKAFYLLQYRKRETNVMRATGWLKKINCWKKSIRLLEVSYSSDECFGPNIWFDSIAAFLWWKHTHTPNYSIFHKVLHLHNRTGIVHVVNWKGKFMTASHVTMSARNGPLFSLNLKYKGHLSVRWRAAPAEIPSFSTIVKGLGFLKWPNLLTTI